MQEEQATGASFGAEAVSASLSDQSSAEGAGCGRQQHEAPTKATQAETSPR